MGSMQTLVERHANPHPLRSGQIKFLVTKNAQCSETYAKTIFRFLTCFRLTEIFISSFWDS